MERRWRSPWDLFLNVREVISVVFLVCRSFSRGKVRFSPRFGNEMEESRQERTRGRLREMPKTDKDVCALPCRENPHGTLSCRRVTGSVKLAGCDHSLSDSSNVQEF